MSQEQQDQQNDIVIHDPHALGMTRSQFEKCVAGALKCTIDAHGNITLNNRSSASKRIVNTVSTFFKQWKQRERVSEPVDLLQRNRLTYLSSPYGNDNPRIRHGRFEDAVTAACSLMHKGVVCYSPIAHNHPIILHRDLGRTWDIWKKFDLTLLSKCDSLIVLMLDGWQQSTGVTAEVKRAVSSAIPVFHMAIDDDCYMITRALKDGTFNPDGPKLRLEAVHSLPSGKDVPAPCPVGDSRCGGPRNSGPTKHSYPEGGRRLGW